MTAPELDCEPDEVSDGRLEGVVMMLESVVLRLEGWLEGVIMMLEGAVLSFEEIELLEVSRLPDVDRVDLAADEGITPIVVTAYGSTEPGQFVSWSTSRFDAILRDVSHLKRRSNFRPYRSYAGR